MRLKYRKDRRPGFPIESPLVFYPKYALEFCRKTLGLARLYLRHYPLRRRIEKDPAATSYTDVALVPAHQDDLDALQLLNATQAARDATAKAKRRALAVQR